MRKSRSNLTVAAVGLSLAVMAGICGALYADPSKPAQTRNSRVLLAAEIGGTKHNEPILPEIKGALESAATVDPTMLIEGMAGDGQISDEGIAALIQRENALSANKPADETAQIHARRQMTTGQGHQ